MINEIIQKIVKKLKNNNKLLITCQSREIHLMQLFSKKGIKLLK